MDAVGGLPTNQVFAVVDNALKPQLDAVCDYEDWCPYDGSHTVVRFVTCFQTSQEDVDGLLAAARLALRLLFFPEARPRGNFFCLIP